MIKIISSKEYAKLTGDVDYWKELALKEENRKNFYENLYKSQKAKGIELIRENQSLDRKLEEFENKNKLSSIYDRLIFQSKLKKTDEEFYSEHNCNRNCFKEHILPAIQRDYDSTFEKFNFLNYWYEKLSKEYHWLESLYIIDGKVYFK